MGNFVFSSCWDCNRGLDRGWGGGGGTTHKLRIDMCCPAHEKNSGIAVSRLGTIIKRVFCAQLGDSIRLTVWKWSGESRYPGPLPPMLENVRRSFSPRPDWPPLGLRGWDRLFSLLRSSSMHMKIKLQGITPPIFIQCLWLEERFYATSL